MAGVVDSGLLYHATLEPSFGEPGGNAIHQDQEAIWIETVLYSPDCLLPEAEGDLEFILLPPPLKC